MAADILPDNLPADDTAADGAVAAEEVHDPCLAAHILAAEARHILDAEAVDRVQRAAVVTTAERIHRTAVTVEESGRCSATAIGEETTRSLVHRILHRSSAAAEKERVTWSRIRRAAGHALAALAEEAR